MVIPFPLLEKDEMVIMNIPFRRQDKEEHVMIMTIRSPLLEKSERVIMTIPSPFWKGKRWWPW